MDELRTALFSVAASMQVLAANTTANTQGLEAVEQGLDAVEQDIQRMSTSIQRMSGELHRMTDRNRQTEEAVQALQCTFASIERHLVKLFEEEAEMKARVAEHEARLNAIERRMPPAA